MHPCEAIIENGAKVGRRELLYLVRINRECYSAGCILKIFIFVSETTGAALPSNLKYSRWIEPISVHTLTFFSSPLASYFYLHPTSHSFHRTEFCPCQTTHLFFVSHLNLTLQSCATQTSTPRARLILTRSLSTRLGCYRTPHPRAYTRIRKCRAREDRFRLNPTRKPRRTSE